MHSSQLKSQAILFVISSPSGVGKSSLATSLITEDPGLCRPVSVTTRSPRIAEVNHQDYHFMTSEAFQKMVKNDEFIEHAMVLGNRYGITKEEIERKLSSNVDIILTIDWQGMLKIKELFAGRLATIYLLPPSIDELRNRLQKRLDPIDEANYRISEAASALVHYHNYDYLVVNDNFEQALDELRCIISAERCRRSNQNLAPAFVSSINKQL